MPHQCTNCGYVFEDGSKEMLSGCPECNGATFQFYPDGREIPETPPDEPPPDPDGGRVSRRVGSATATVRGWMSSKSSTTKISDDESAIDISDDENSNNISNEENGSDNTEDSEPLDTTESEKSRDETDAESEMSRDETDVVTDEREMNEADLLESEARESEDSAQANARSEFVSPDKIPSSSASSSSTSSSFSSSGFQSSSSPPSDGRVVREPTGERPDLTDLREELNDQFESIKIIEPGEYELNLMGLYDREEYIIALQENGRYVIQMPETWLGNDE